MAAPFLPQAQIQAPRNALLDFSGINNALDSNRRNALLESQQEMQREELGMRRQTHDLNVRKFDQDNEMATVKRLGMRAQAIDALPPNDPRRAQAWGAIMKEHPGGAGLDPSWHDPVQGPKMLMAEAGQWEDPLKRQLLQAQIAKANREASGTGPESYGKSGSVFQGPDGRFYSIQFGERGTRSIQPVEAPGQGPGPGAAGPPTAPTPLAPARGVTTVGDEVISNATGATVRNVGGAIAGGEQAKVEGREQGQLRASIPKLEMGFRMFTDKSDRLTGVIDRALGRISSTTTGPGAVLANIPATEARALRNDLDTIRANIGFEELQAMRDASPTGGALGQVSEMENRLLQSIRGAMDQFDRGENLAQNLQIIRQSVTQLKALKADQMQQDRTRAGAGSFAGPGVAPQSPSSGGWSIQRID